MEITVGARVRTRTNELRQLIALREFGLTDRAIFVDKQSGKDFDRRSYQRLLREIERRRYAMIKVIDRLEETMRKFWSNGASSQRKSVRQSLCWICLCLTRGGTEITGTLIADIVLQLLSYVAQTEREFIHQRQAEGIAAAKARGVKFGRPRKSAAGRIREKSKRVGSAASCPHGRQENCWASPTGAFALGAG